MQRQLPPSTLEQIYPLGDAFFALDLDHTLYYTDCEDNDVKWIDSADNWLDFFLALQDEAEQAGLRLIFGVVTSKGVVDPIVVDIACQFKPLFIKHNKGMYKENHDGDFFLVSIHEELIYMNFENDLKMRQSLFPCAFPPGLFSVIEIFYGFVKDYLTKRIAAAYGITDPKRMFLFDNLPKNLEMAAAAGINTVSAECFDPDYLVNMGHTTKILLDDNYVKPHVERLRAEIRTNVLELIASLTAERIAALNAAVLHAHSRVQEELRSVAEQAATEEIKLLLNSGTNSGTGSAGSSSPPRSDTDSIPEFANTSPYQQFNLFKPAINILNPNEINRQSSRLMFEQEDDVEYFDMDGNPISGPSMVIS